MSDFSVGDGSGASLIEVRLVDFGIGEAVEGRSVSNLAGRMNTPTFCANENWNRYFFNSWDDPCMDIQE